jgi:hypothetical protein
VHPFAQGGVDLESEYLRLVPGTSEGRRHRQGGVAGGITRMSRGEKLVHLHLEIPSDQADSGEVVE